MQDEELDKLINDAANQHHPPYDDKAWGKMAALLDEHLPQKKDRKKFIFWILLFLLLGGSVITAIVQPWKKPVATAAIESTTEKKLPAADNSNNNVKQNLTAPVTANNDVAITNNTTATTAKQINGTNVAPVDNTSSKIVQYAPLPKVEKNVAQSGNNTTGVYKRKGRFAVKVKKPAAVAGDEEDSFENNVVKQKIHPVKTNEDAGEPLPGVEKQKEAAAIATGIAGKEEKDIAIVTADSTKDVSTEKEKLAAEKKSALPEKKKTDKGFVSNFAIAVSAGADVSYISIDNAGKLKPFYGAGIRYNIGKHFTVSSGLYVSKKIYDATPGQYKFTTGYPNPNLVNINADCKIYEIPLTVYYNFKQTKNHNWFGALGLSSYLMKQEAYDYMFKTPTGQSWNYVKEVSNENKHYFSVLTLSGGYQYKLNKRIYFLAEPYLKLPVNNGVGLGKVKLNSAGLLFTVAIQPFVRRK
jgi:hypothetical protein